MGSCVEMKAGGSVREWLRIEVVRWAGGAASVTMLMTKPSVCLIVMISLSMGNAHNVLPKTNFGATQRKSTIRKVGMVDN